MKRLKLIILGILLSIGILFTAQAMMPGRTAFASFGHPWWRVWSSDWRAKGQASATHAGVILNIVPHIHSGDWSTYAEIFGLDPDQDGSNIFWMIPGPDGIATRTAGGSSEVNGEADDQDDGYASGKVLVTGFGDDNFQYCTICGPVSWE